MKVILLEDIKNIGRRGEIKTFSDGYVQNFLLPKKLAEIATKERIHVIEYEKKQKSSIVEVKQEILIGFITDLDTQILTIYKKVNSIGHLFEKITEKQISELIFEHTQKRIPVEYIHIQEPIKHTGEFPVHLGDFKKLKKEALLTLVVKGQ